MSGFRSCFTDRTKTSVCRHGWRACRRGRGAAFRLLHRQGYDCFNSDRLSPAPSDNDQGDRSHASRSSSDRTAAVSMPASAPMCSLLRRHGRRKRPAASSSISRSACPTNSPPTRPCAKPARSWPPPALPPDAVAVRRYHPRNRIAIATVRFNYPRVAAEAGPCGLWPADLGPTYEPQHYENKPYWNLGCASQRNLAAMVANPADLVQPRGEDSDAYKARRSVVLESYRKGDATGTRYPIPTKA